MAYQVKEIFYTLQGEGAHAGKAAVFCRFAGCNLWSGREQDRSKAICQFCDTDFVGTDGVLGGRYATAEQLAEKITDCWQAEKNNQAQRFVVLTGGEPLLQVDRALISALHEQGFYIAVETNGTLAAPEGIDWICVSPKAGASLVQMQGDELKVVVPQNDLDWSFLETLQFKVRSVQAMDGLLLKQNMAWAVAWCKKYPQWRLSIQTHKMIGIP